MAFEGVFFFWEAFAFDSGIAYQWILHGPNKFSSSRECSIIGASQSDVENATIPL
jgi:hypothetical protein